MNLRAALYAGAALFLVALGILLRLPQPSRSSAQASAATQPTAEAIAPLVVQTVQEFYRSLDSGNFAAAYDRCLELQWQWDGSAYSQVVGLKDRDRFSTESQAELGKDGKLMTLMGVVTVEPGQLEQDLPELAALRTLADAPHFGDVARVTVRGSVKLACQVRSFERTMAVLETADGWKLLLPPPDPASRSRMQALFLIQGNPIFAP